MIVHDNGKATQRRTADPDTKKPRRRRKSPAKKLGGFVEPCDRDLSLAPGGADPYRDEHGRFRAGNPGGVGNPYARQVAILRRRFMQRTRPEEIDAIADKLIELAKDGNVPAAKLVLSYTLGSPTTPISPDKVGLDELQIFFDEAEASVRGIKDCGGLDLVLDKKRLERQVYAYQVARAVYGFTTATGEELQRYQELSAHMSPAEQLAYKAKLGDAKYWPPFRFIEWFKKNWQPWSEEDGQMPTTYPPVSMVMPTGVPTVTGQYVAPQTAAPQTGEASAPSPDGGNGASTTAGAPSAPGSNGESKSSGAPSPTGSNGASRTTAAQGSAPSTTASNGTSNTASVPSPTAGNGAPAAAPQATPPSKVASPRANGAPSTNGANGKHHAKGKRRAPVNRLKKARPSTNGVIGARSKHALLPKSMRPKGTIVPRF